MSGIIPAIIQDAETNLVLMVGFMNIKAAKITIKNKTATFWSRTKKRLWEKGEVSGNKLDVVSISMDCDKDAILIKAKPRGPTCHQGIYSCFGENQKIAKIELFELFKIIQSRKEKMPEKSYTTSLFKSGLDKISLKLAEEVLEVVQAGQKQTKKRLIEETVDLIYHLFVLLVNKKISFKEIENEIKKRRKSS